MSIIFNNIKLFPEESGGINGVKTSGDNLSEALKKSSENTSKVKPVKKSSGNDFDKLSLRLMIIVAGVVLVLALVNSLTADIIIKRELEAGIAARQSLIPEATDFNKIEELSLSAEEAKVVDDVYEGSDAETLYGYCVDVSPVGFGGNISMIVAISPELAVIGVKVISHAETPGIGAAVLSENSELLSQYKDLPSRSLDAVSAISGATVSSTAVKSGIKSAVSVVEKLVGGVN
ncbi:MAG: rnfG [Clostridia bacterium]|nr:rnfG [Clostridia bacterium]